MTHLENASRRTLQVEAIRHDLRRIIEDWVKLHFRVAILFIAVAMSVEIMLAFYIKDTVILSTTIWRYILKFIAIPTLASGLCLLVSWLILRSEKASLQAKTYAVSLLIVALCFIYYTAHSAFVAIFALYVYAIFMTATYADYRLTGVVTMASIGSFVLSELLLYWDTDKVRLLDDPNRMVNVLIAISVLVGCSIIVNVTIKYERKKNEMSLRKDVERELLRESLQHDELTGVYNRKALHDVLRSLELGDQTRRLVFGIADIDHFKLFNDKHGHQIGDQCLSEFACILTEHFGEDNVYRYGGDEFCLVLYDIPLEEALLRCERVQARFQRVTFDGAAELKATASFGLTISTTKSSMSELFNNADEALYEAKITRNTIRVFGGQNVTQP